MPPDSVLPLWLCPYKPESTTLYPEVKKLTVGESAITVADNSSDKAEVVELSATSGVNGTTFTFKVNVTEGFELEAVKANGTILEAVEGVYTATITGPTQILVQTKVEGAVTLPSLTIDGSTETSAGGTVTSNLKAAGSGYRQTDSAVQEYYYQIKADNPYYEVAPAKLSITVKLGTGSDKDVEDANAAYVVLIDKDGNAIDGTATMLTKSFKKATEEYTVEIVPTSAFAGIKVYETKVASWNMRLYSISVVVPQE